jgi:hypothetical protein
MRGFVCINKDINTMEFHGTEYDVALKFWGSN